MKYLRLVVSLSLVAFLATFSIASAASYDSDQATFQKAGAHTAKVMIGSKTYTAPIHFEAGASWATVKDHYELSKHTASEIKEGEMAILVKADGAVAFTKIKSESKSEPKSEKKAEAKK